MLLHWSSPAALESIGVFDVVCADGGFAIQLLDAAMWRGDRGRKGGAWIILAQ